MKRPIMHALFIISFGLTTSHAGAHRRATEIGPKATKHDSPTSSFVGKPTNAEAATVVVAASSALIFLPAALVPPSSLLVVTGMIGFSALANTQHSEHSGTR